MFYAQLDINNICVGIANLSGAVPEYNYIIPEEYDPITGKTTTGEKIFVSRMIQIPKYSETFLGLHYTDDGKWERVS